jgi:tripartite-type tricarboxylate transporter receptor subunit TctC
MKIPRRRFLHLVAGAAALPIIPLFAAAQTYAAKPVRTMVGYAAGDATDTVARMTGYLRAHPPILVSSSDSLV